MIKERRKKNASPLFKLVQAEENTNISHLKCVKQRPQWNRRSLISHMSISWLCSRCLDERMSLKCGEVATPPQSGLFYTTSTILLQFYKFYYNSSANAQLVACTVSGSYGTLCLETECFRWITFLSCLKRVECTKICDAPKSLASSHIIHRRQEIVPLSSANGLR